MLHAPERVVSQGLGELRDRHLLLDDVLVAFFTLKVLENEKNFEEKLDSVRREKARLALKRIQDESNAKGYDRLSMKEIEEMISEYRKGRKGSRAAK